MIVKNSVRCADDSFAVTFGIPRESESRLHVVRVGLNSFLQAESSVSGLSQSSRRFELRRKLHVIAHTIVQSNIGTNLPGILPEHAQWFVRERIGGTPKTLNEVARQSCAISLNRIEHGKRRRECSDGSEIVYATIVHREGRVDGKIVEVRAELRIVTSDRP